MCCRCCTVTQQKFWVFGAGLLFLLLGILLAAGGPFAVRSVVISDFVLTPGTRAYSMWSVTPIPVYLNMYLFNWTNADQARVSGVVPNFEQLGPYVFSQLTTKEEVEFNSDNTLSFRNRRVWTWEPKMSNGSLDDLITAPHIPSLGAASIMRNSFRLAKIAFNTALNANGGALYQTHTANEWLFEGFEDKFLTYASSLPIGVSLGNYKDHFGWFYERNGSSSYEGVFTVNTGAVDSSKLGELVLWKGLPNTGYFEGDCGKLNGSTTDIFPPGLNHRDPITIFVTDTTRIINLYPTNISENINGIDSVRYDTTWDTYDNGQRNADMYCYCPVALRPDNCPPSGATSLSAMLNGVPIHLSHPNFLYADPHYAETITGLRPDYERDIFSIHLEPTLSIPLRLQGNVMASLRIESDRDFTITRNLPKYFYAPLFVVSNVAVLPKSIARQIQLIVNLPNIVRYVGYSFMLLGILIFSIGGIITRTNNWYGQTKRI